jgi:hypothetical protein
VKENKSCLWIISALLVMGFVTAGGGSIMAFGQTDTDAVPDKQPDMASAQTDSAVPGLVPERQRDIWYGADLSDFPPEVVEWIKNRAFTKEKMEKEWSVNPQLKVWWSEDGNAVLAEASYTIASGYVGAGSVEKWGQDAKYGGAKIGAEYGEYAKYRTLRFRWELKKESERLYNTDPAYRAVIDVAKKMCKEIEYDWANFSGYHGAAVKRTPGLVYAVCDGYADAAMEKLLSVDYVKTVEKWSLPGIHAWNNVILKDGRRLYVDVTWFDNEHINHETGKIYETDDYDWENITFHKDLFEHSNVGYGSGIFAHADPHIKVEAAVSK